MVARVCRTVIFLWISCTQLASHGQSALFNEIASSNGSGLQDENGDFPDWIELYNPAPAPLNLQGYGLSDDPDRPFKWTLGPAILPPSGHLLIFASGKNRQPTSALPISPDQLAGLKVWLSAAAIATNDLNQVRPTSGSLFVRSWRNLVDPSTPALQDDPQRQPIWIAPSVSPNTPPSPPALRFDGLNDLLRLASVPARDNFTVIAIARTSVPHQIDSQSTSGASGVSGQRYLFGAAHGGAFNAGAGLSLGTNGVSAYEHGDNYMPAVAVHAGPLGAQFQIVTLLYKNKQPALFLQGLPAQTGLPSSRASVLAPTEVGSGSYGSFQGDLAEVLIFTRSLLDSERLGVETFLALKHNLQLRQSFHANFQLRSTGEPLLLTRPNGQPSDQLPALSIPRNVSFGRQPDGQSQWLFFAQPTPSGPNTTPGSSEWLEPPEFSHPAGFYTSNISLALTSPSAGAEIRFTLDGSEPTLASTLYDSPILITNRAALPNQLSLIPTVPGYSPPSAPVFKGTSIRAKTFKPSALPSSTVTRTFFIHPKGHARYTVPVVALTTPAKNFFDATLGIYVPGRAPGGNYSQRGNDWQRPVHVEFIETNGTVAFAQNGDVKIHGNTSQNFPIKGLDLDATGGEGRQPFRHRIFPDRTRTQFEHFLLRPSGHDHHLAFMRDEFMQSLASDFGMESQAARLAVVFLNGEYWGLHYLKEKEDADFVAFYGNTSTDNIDYLEGYAAARAGDTQHYDALISFLRSTDLQQPGAYHEINARVDLPNYIDYKVSEIFCYRWDIGNHRLWRPRGPEGRWRWLQFDNDVGWGGFWAEQPAWAFNMLEADTTPNGSLHDHNNETTTYLLRRLLENPIFKSNFINRFADLLNSTYQPAHTINRINSFATHLEPEMQEHINRWRAPGSLAQWRNNVQYLRTYASLRPDYARQHLVQKFKLSGTVSLALASSDPLLGTVQINTLSTAAPIHSPWRGVYFKTIPIQLSALPKPGARFSHWEGIVGMTTNSMTLLLNSDLSLLAHFTPDLAPSFSSIQLKNASLQLTISGRPNASYRLLISHDCIAWSELQLLQTNPDGVALLEIPITPIARFFYLQPQ